MYAWERIETGSGQSDIEQSGQIAESGCQTRLPDAAVLPTIRVKISKNCQGSFGPTMSCFYGPTHFFKGPEFLISPFQYMGFITASRRIID